MTTMDLEFQNVIDDFETKYGFCFSKPTISTLTIVCRLNKNVILDDIRQNKSLHIRTSKGSKKSKKPYRCFNNSVTIVFDKKKTIKLFSNSRLHITGCTSLTYATSIIDRLISSMEWVDIEICDMRILTLNTTMAIKPKTLISLDKFHHFLTDKNIQSRYTPDVYQGLIIKEIYEKTQKKISFMCFYTGSIIISGVTKPCELQFGLKFLYEILKEMLPIIKT